MSLAFAGLLAMGLEVLAFICVLGADAFFLTPALADIAVFFLVVAFFAGAARPLDVALAADLAGLLERDRRAEEEGGGVIVRRVNKRCETGAERRAEKGSRHPARSEVRRGKSVAMSIDRRETEGSIQGSGKWASAEGFGG